jgi:hypothetical protein
VEKKFNLRKTGKWMEDQTKQEKEWNLQSAYASAAVKPSEQQSASRKSNMLKDKKSLFLFFGFSLFFEKE